MNDTLIQLLHSGVAPAPARTCVADWWPTFREQAAQLADPVALALRGGFDADRVGWAFASGYQAALRRLVPQLPRDQVAAFCVTEEAGNRPRDIRTRIDAADGGYVIRGAKRWTTLGPDSALLLVVGAVSDDAARPALKVACVPANTPGLQLLPMPETRFVPEVPHARVQLDAVRIDAAALLPGDGYADYVKPFRTVEDAHVTLAVLAYLLRESRLRDWPAPFRERLCAVLAALAAVAAARADDAATHVALAGALTLAHGVYAEAGTLFGQGDETASRWQRDAALFAVASAARTQRATRAWERLATA